MKVFISCATVVVAILTLSAPAKATPTTYQYIETEANLPDWHVAASVTIDGTFADLPTLYCSGHPVLTTCPTDFGPLLALSVDPPYPHFDLSLFRTAAFTDWSIQPNAIFYSDLFGEFRMNFALGTIYFNSDANNRCWALGCTTTGYWAPVPEPFSGSLLGLGLLGLAGERIRARRSTRSD